MARIMFLLVKEWLMNVATKMSSRKEPGLRHKGPTRDCCSQGQRRHFHPTPRDKKSHPRRVATETKNGLEGYQG